MGDTKDSKAVYMQLSHENLNVLHITPAGFLDEIEGLYEPNLCDLLKKSGLKVKALTLTGDETRDYVTSFSKRKNFLNRLLKEIASFDCDLVHLHSIFWSEFPYLAFILTQLLKGRRPSVLTSHAFDPEAMKKPTALLRKAIETSDFAALRRAFRLTSYYVVDRIIAMSNAERRYLVEKMGIGRQKISVIPNGVNLEDFSKWYSFKEANGINDEHIVLYVGQLIPEKGIHYLLLAFKQLLTSGHKCRLLAITRSPESEISRFSLQCRKLGVLNQLSVFSQLDKRFKRIDLVSAYRCCDVLVLPSLQECCPGVVLEAMAAERPVVATKVGGLNEMVHNGISGYLVEPREPYQLANRISELLDDENLRKTLGRKGLVFVKDKYDWRIVAPKILRLYEEIVADSA